MTDQQKEFKKARDNLGRFSAAIRTQFSFHKIKTFYDLLKAVGYDNDSIKRKYFPFEYDKVLTYQDVQDYLSDRHIELTTEQWLKENPPQTNHDIRSTNGLHDQSILLEKDKKEEIQEEKEFKQSPDEKAFFFWFQKKSITQ